MRKFRPVSSTGINLVEVMVAVAIIAVVGLVLAKALASVMWVAQRSRLEMRGHRVVQSIKEGLDTMPFEFVLPVDTAQPNWGLGAKTAYEGIPLLQRLRTESLQAGFPRFRIEVTPMRRDLSNVGGGGTGALIAFTDANADGIDDYDSNIRYQDFLNVGPQCLLTIPNLPIPPPNSGPDGDFFGVLDVNGTRYTEFPMTNMRQVKVSLFTHRDPQNPFLTENFLISKEKVSGSGGTSQEQNLPISISVPAAPRILYQRTTVAQNIAQGLVLDQPYTNNSYRADAVSSLQITGKSVPFATVIVSTVNPPEAAAVGARDQTLCDVLSDFNFITTPNTTALLQEGENFIYYRAYKVVSMLGVSYTLTSPVGRLNVLWDIRVPDFNDLHAVGNNIKSLSPAVGAVFLDNTISTTSVSGVSAETITVKVKQGMGPGVWTAYSGPNVFYNNQTGLVRWRNPVNHLPVVLNDKTWYQVIVEGGDRARYGNTVTWNLRPNIAAVDNTPPVVDSEFPAPMAINVVSPVTIRFRVEDPDSGVDFSTLVLTVDGVPVLSSGVTPLIGDYVDARTGLVTAPSLACPSGVLRNVQVQATHWGVTGVPAQDTVTRNWNFTCQ